VAIDDLAAFVGGWELSVDLPGGEDVRGQVVFDRLGEVLVQRTSVPVPEAPDSCSVVVCQDGGYTQHYFDSRGVARLYAMSFDGRTWTLERTKSDFTPLDFSQRFIASFTDDLAEISGEWQTSDDGREWHRDFGMIYRRLRSE
jgi:hypothetical protein